MTQLNPYLSFEGNCREAMTFYKECLGGELTMQAVEESPAKDQMPPEAQHQILHSSLTKGDMVLMASDMIMSTGLVRGNDVSLSLNCSSEDEINTTFAKLAEGGEITHALTTEFWGGIFGTLTDKFGYKWLFNYQKPTA